MDEDGDDANEESEDDDSNSTSQDQSQGAVTAARMVKTSIKGRIHSSLVEDLNAVIHHAHTLGASQVLMNSVRRVRDVLKSNEDQPLNHGGMWESR
jgi:hypothetical protein